MTWVTVKYFGCSVLGVRFTNLWVGRGLDEQPLVLGGGGFRARWLRGRGAEQPVVRLELALGDCRFSCYLGQDGVDALLHGAMDAGDLFALDEAWQLAIVESALTELGEALQESLGLSLRLLRVQAATEPAPATCIHLRVSSEVQGQAGWTLSLLLDADLPDEVFSFLRQLGTQTVQDLSWLPLPVTAEVGYTRVPPQTAQALSTGDILLLDGCHGALRHETPEQLQPGRLQLNIASQLFAACSCQDGQLVLESLPVPAGAAEPAASSEDSTGVTLRFVVARTSVTVAGLADLVPGQTLALPGVNTSQVEVMVNSEVFATGELVEVNGQQGVRLIKARD